MLSLNLRVHLGCILIYNLLEYSKIKQPNRLKSLTGPYLNMSFTPTTPVQIRLGTPNNFKGLAIIS